MDYYLSHHISMTKAAWMKHGMTGCPVCRDESGSGFDITVVMAWTGMKAWDAAQKDGATQEILKDFGNFTDVQSEMVVGKVVG